MPDSTDQEISFPSGIPILMYHKIDSRNEVGINAVSPDRFESHIHWLNSQGYQSITIKDMELDSHPEKPIILTFDDGYLSVYKHALPILQKYNMRGVVYAISGFLGKHNTWDVNLGGITFLHLHAQALKELQDLGWEIGAHTVTHRGLTLFNVHEIRRELSESKESLESHLGKSIVSVAYPFGLCNSTVRDIANQAGFRYGCVCLRHGLGTSDRLMLPRIPVYQFDGTTQLEKKLRLKGSDFEYLKLRILSYPAIFTPWYQKMFKRELVLDP